MKRFKILLRAKTSWDDAKVIEFEDNFKDFIVHLDDVGVLPSGSGNNFIPYYKMSDHNFTLYTLKYSHLFENIIFVDEWGNSI